MRFSKQEDPNRLPNPVGWPRIFCYVLAIAAGVTRRHRHVDRCRYRYRRLFTVDALLSPIITFLASIPPTAIVGSVHDLVWYSFDGLCGIVALGIFFSWPIDLFKQSKQTLSSDHIDKAYTLGASETEKSF